MFKMEMTLGYVAMLMLMKSQSLTKGPFGVKMVTAMRMASCSNIFW